MYIYIYIYIYIVTVHHVPKSMSCHKAIAVITARVHCFRDCIYIKIYIYICIHLFIDGEIKLKYLCYSEFHA